MSKYINGNVNVALVLGTLGPDTLISADPSDSVSEAAFATSAVLRWALSNYTDGATLGPIMVGLAHSDYTDTEVEQWVERASSWELGDKISQEVSRRLIRKVGVFLSPEDAAHDETLNDGKPIKTKLGWRLTTGQTISIWAYNMGTGALVTTSPRVDVQGHINLFAE